MSLDLSPPDHTPRRRPSGGGYARGEETRARIVEAALKVFGDEGYERASTRRIAEKAGVKPPALQYYFDSKEGLHRACAEHILASAGELFDRLAEVETQLTRDGPSTALDGICSILDVLIDLSCRSEPIPGKAGFLIRAQAEGAGPALPLIRERLIRPMQATLARLVASALGRSPQDEGVRLKSSLILAQVAAFHGARENTLDFLGWPDLDGPRGAAVKQALRAHTHAALSAD